MLNILRYIFCHRNFATFRQKPMSGWTKQMLRLETLEDRRLLSVSPMGLDESMPMVVMDIVQQEQSMAVITAEINDANTLAAQKAGKTGILHVTTLADNTDATDGKISLREAFAYAGTSEYGTTIQFDVSGTILLNGKQLEINKSLTILGEEKITINAQQQSRCFGVYGSSEVVFSGLKITGGKIDAVAFQIPSGMDWNPVSENYEYYYKEFVSGGGIYGDSGSKITVKNTSITGNIAWCGGGVYGSDNSVIDITDSIISDNMANLANSGACGDGGGVYGNIFSNITVANTTFSGNEAHNDGGGICGDSNSSITVTDVIISGNKAGFGGGISGGSYSSITVMKTSITGNAGKFSGGVLGSDYSVIRITDSIISDNLKDDEYNVSSDNGAGISGGHNGNIAVMNSTISNNQGSGICGITNGNTIEIMNSTFSGNQYDGIDGDTITVSGSTFSGNQYDGIYGNTIIVGDSTFSDNYHKGIWGDTITATNSTISDNQGYGIWGRADAYSMQQVDDF